MTTGKLLLSAAFAAGALTLAAPPAQATYYGGWGYGGGYYRPYFGYRPYYRPYYAYWPRYRYRRHYGYYRPYRYRPAYFGYDRPYGYYRPYYGGFSWGGPYLSIGFGSWW